MEMHQAPDKTAPQSLEGQRLMAKVAFLVMPTYTLNKF